MTAFSKTSVLILLICFSQIISIQKQFLDKGPVKPFISVLTPESMKRLQEDSQKIRSSILQKEQEPIFLTETEGDGEVAEKKLREISFAVKCMFVDDFNVFDISRLGINTLKTDKRAYNHTFTEENAQIFYNFCYDIKEVDGCDYSNKQILSKEGSKCIPLANSINKGNKWSTWADADNSTILRIEPNQNDTNHTVLYKLKCNPEKKEMYFNDARSYYKKEVDGKYETVLFIESKEACTKFDFYVIWKFINDYVYIFAIILIAFGIFNCILGKRLAQYTSFILTLVGVTALCLFLFQYILPSGCAQWIIWVILAVGVILGCTAGYFVFKYHDKFMAFLVGGLAGFLLGQFLYNLFGASIKGNATLINILFIVLSIIALIVVAFFIRDFIIIFATSFIGAYAFIRGISLFAGHFPSEFTIMDLRKRGEDEQFKQLFTWRVYVYLAFILVTFGLSIFIQYKINKGLKDKEKETPSDPNLIEKK